MKLDVDEKTKQLKIKNYFEDLGKHKAKFEKSKNLLTTKTESISF